MAQVRPADGVIVHEAAGDAFLLHVESGRYFGLNRTGLVVWQALVDGTDPVDALAGRYPGVARATLGDDAAALLSSLRTAGLLDEEPSQAPGA
jgi:coenzyme PQQ synthesis protein D (PqqD)